MSDFVGYPLHGPRVRTLEEWHYDAYYAHSTKGEPLLDIVAERDALRTENEKLRAALLPFASIKADDGDGFSGLPDTVIVRIEASVRELKAARAALGEK